MIKKITYFLLVISLSLLVFCPSAFSEGLREKITEIFIEDDTVVTAAKQKQKISEAAASVFVITSDDIRRYGYRKLSDALRSVPGFYVTDDGIYESLGVRGISIPSDYTNECLLLINGLSTDDSVYGQGFIGYDLGIDMESVKRIEIVKGPGSALYGSYALFSVINVITKDGTDVGGLRISGECGSYDTAKGIFLYGNKLDNRLDIFFFGYQYGSRGQSLYFPAFDVISENCDWAKSYGYFLHLASGDFKFQGKLSNRDKGIPLGEYGFAIFNDSRSKVSDYSNFLELKYTPRLDENKDLMVKVYTQQFSGNGDYFSWYMDPFGELYEEENRTLSRDDRWGLEAQLNWKTSERNFFTFGGEYQDHLSGYHMGHYQNTGAYKASGVELNLKANWKNNVEAHLSYCIQEARDTQIDLDLLNSPRNLGNLGISVPLCKDKLFFTQEMLWLGKRLNINGVDWVPPYFKTNAILYSSKLLDNTDITFKVENIFDTPYYNPLSPIEQDPNPQLRQYGRNYLLKVDYTFQPGQLKGMPNCDRHSEC